MTSSGAFEEYLKKMGWFPAPLVSRRLQFCLIRRYHRHLPLSHDVILWLNEDSFVDIGEAERWAADVVTASVPKVRLASSIFLFLETRATGTLATPVAIIRKRFKIIPVLVRGDEISLPAVGWQDLLGGLHSDIELVKQLWRRDETLTRISAFEMGRFAVLLTVAALLTGMAVGIALCAK